MTTWSLTLQTLSPVHIGAGQELRLGFDFMLFQGKTWILDSDAILEAKVEQLKPGVNGRYPLPGQLLGENDYGNKALFRYVLRGQPRSTKADARMQAFIKDVYDRPYIPGSSLKGAIRTALAWKGWEELRMPPLRREDIGNNRNWAAKPLEGKIFGRDPNHDLLRVLQVSDLHGPAKAGEGLIVVNAQVLTRKAMQSPIELEALPGGLNFNGSLTIDDTLFASWAEPKLGFRNRKPWLDQLLPRVNAHSQARITRLQKWFESLQNTAPNAEKIVAFYRQLAGVKLQPNQALLQIGWGAGWDGKTYWTHLQQDKMLFERLVREFRMDKAGKNSRRRPGDPFPTSRRVAMSGEKPLAPFGWVLIQLEER